MLILTALALAWDGGATLLVSQPVVRAYTAASRVSPVSVLEEQAENGLIGTRWKLMLDVGQERGSWMPPAWGRSGDRARAQIVVSFESSGELRVLETGVYDARVVQWDGPGGWELKGEFVTFWLPHNGFRRSDVELKPARLYFSSQCWGSILSKRGILAIKERKLGWLPFLPTLNEGSFIVGIFEAQSHPIDAPPLGATLY